MPAILVYNINALMIPSVTVRFRKKRTKTNAKPANAIGKMSNRKTLEQC